MALTRITALDSGIQCETGAYKNIGCGQDAQRARLAKPAPHPKKMDDEERYCRQVEQVQKIEAEAQARHAATEDELFPIYAECGMAPDDFVPATAERFAEYLMRANRMEA